MKGNGIEKMFLEERSGKTYRTLSAAKTSHKAARVYRIWTEDGREIGRSLVFAYGEQVGTIRTADAMIGKKAAL